MVTTGDADLNRRLRYLRSHGMSTLTLDRHKGRAITYDVVEPGLNYRMDEMRAAIGLVQLDKLESGNQRRKVLTERYRANLSGSGVNMPFAELATNAVSAYHILPVMLPAGSNRTAIIERMKAQGIQPSIHYPPFWNFSAYAGQFKASDAPQVADVCERQLTLPLYPTMTEKEIDLVTAALLGSL